MKFKHLIDDIAIDHWSSRNFGSMEDIEKNIYNLMVDLSKFTFNKKKKKLSGVLALVYNQVCC